MTHSIYPALRLKKNAKTALQWYCSIFPNSQIMQEHDTALKVQFADKEVSMVTNITMEIDGQKLFNKSYNVPAAIEKHVNLMNKNIR